MKFTTIVNARKQTGLSYLGGVSTSSKIMHSQKYSHQYTYAIYLAPSKQSGYNVCSHSTPECRMGCLNTSGRAGMEIICGKSKTLDCRNKKVRLFFEENEFFMNWMIAEIKMYQRRAEKNGFFFSVRLNATSDIDWTNVFLNNLNIFEIFPDVSFYDYTKNHNKFENKPENYHLTYSYTGRNIELCKVLLQKGFNIAVVFNVKHEINLPKYFMNHTVINGDLTDYRIDDAKGIIVGLKWKRIANRIAEKKVLNSCFVIQPDNVLCEYETSNVQEEAVLV
ncbi:MAG: hypothetical protein WC428_01905 [Candidatus Paceibacterota bacterium]|jgi:hypothetical protein